MGGSGSGNGGWLGVGVADGWEYELRVGGSGLASNMRAE